MAASTNLYAALAGYVGRPDQTGRSGVFRRDAAGGEWQHVLPDLEAYTVVVHPRQGALVLAGTADGVWRSEDRGATFARAHFPDNGKQIWSFLVDASNPDRVYAGGSPIDVYRSENRGRSWLRLPRPSIAERAKAPFAARVMRAWRSTRRGRTKSMRRLRSTA